MRQFIIIGHEVPTTPDFSLDDTAGGAGRLDVLCRCVTGAFLLSHSIRSDVRCRVVLSDSYTIRFEGSELRGLHPDERSTAARIKSTLEHRDRAIGHMEANPSPGVYLSRVGVETTLTNAAEEGTVIELHEDGQPIGASDLPTDPVFVLSDHRDFTETEATLLSETATQRVRLGPRRLHADQAITVAHHCLDTNGYTEF
ncbi:tRNA (pseudouridine(54)-N(1))-methyltransferase TrmY [Halocatena pleomorpha]|uniref:tRNA (pseudouridine(54)-N(1))-methyltransferase n=1 Tax=Halocatena pleomorpha TaxID=1785090 RepID=A0A3P3RFX5_9EURY|nr:tRNA (pseudouridine(54)-N(1))-methyltransferase TrmY [Halocatena pleomorpha]RRJ32342.1 tRNA (pseudouridine(54)-N(1))-methyltransferase TrmY [Halocatena pleomorpha]